MAKQQIKRVRSPRLRRLAIKRWQRTQPLFMIATIMPRYVVHLPTAQDDWMKEIKQHGGTYAFGAAA